MPGAHDSFRLETDETLRAWLMVRSLVASSFCLRLHYFLQSCLEKLVLFLADNENGTRRGAHDSLSRAADAQVAPTGITVRRDHDQIDVQLLGRFGDLVRCMPDPHD